MALIVWGVGDTRVSAAETFIGTTQSNNANVYDNNFLNITKPPIKMIKVIKYDKVIIL